MKSLRIVGRFIIILAGFWFFPMAIPAKAETPAIKPYSIEIKLAPTPQAASLEALLKQHLSLVKWRDNPRVSPAEWLRLYRNTPSEIADLLATEGYFSPIIKATLEDTDGLTKARFVIDAGQPVIVNMVEINFTGDITQQSPETIPTVAKLRQNWLLAPGIRFRQEDWNQAKRRLLINMLIGQYPNASIKNSKAIVNPQSNTAALTINIDSGQSYRFGQVIIEGLQRYPASIIENLNPIKPGSIYSQSKLQAFQSLLEGSGYFQGVEVMADTSSKDENVAPVKVIVQERQSIKVSIGAGYSTNTGARGQLNYDDLDLFDRGWRLTSSLKPEQRAQSLSALIRLPTTSKGYRDSINVGLERKDIEGQVTTFGQAGINRSWGPHWREQTVGINYLIENQTLDGAASDTKKAATLSYGITLRRTDNDQNPTRGYLLNTQFAVAPIALLTDGRFLQSRIKIQGYYPVTSATQLIARAEIGMVNGENSAPQAFLFRAGGDQSVRGYAYESLGVTKGNAIVGGRYLLAGSIEAIQWFTNAWGAAVFVDFGNASNTLQELKPVYGYGIGARWKSPIGPVGADIAYGEATGEYRAHFNLGVAF